MYTAIKGEYKNGVLTFLEPVPKVKKAKVIVTFLLETESTLVKKRIPGGLLHLGGKIPENFNDSLDYIFELWGI